MNLKHIAAAALAVVGATALTPAFAAINPNESDAELFVVVFDGAASYTKDLGISIASFLGSSELANTPASAFSFAAGPAFIGTPLATSTTAKWALLAVDFVGVGDPGDYHVLSTSKGGGVPAYPNNGDFVSSVATLGAFVADVSQTGSHPVALTVNGESYNPIGTRGFYDDTALGNAQLFTANNIGVSSSVYYATNSDYDTALFPSYSKLAGTASFDGTTFSYTVTAVPEAEGVVMALAGLGLLGFIGRRRRAA